MELTREQEALIYLLKKCDVQRTAILVITLMIMHDESLVRHMILFMADNQVGENEIMDEVMRVCGIIR